MVDGKAFDIDADLKMPLLWVLRDIIGKTGPKFGCGIAACGACTVRVDGQAVRSCVTPIDSLVGAQITTLEGLGTLEKPHALQRAFIAEQAAQCGYCINGMIMSAKALLDRNPKPSETEVREALATNLCRCGTHNLIVRAILRAADEMGRT